jgi:hypothetical protein
MGLNIGLIVSLISLIFLRDALNRYVYRYLLLLVRREKIATLFFAFLFLPGVALHEASHWLTAKLLFVRTHKFSLLPEWVEEGTIRFGYVELSKTDRLRSAIIGLAPLVVGVTAILWIAFQHLNLDMVLQGLATLELDAVSEGLRDFSSTPDLFLWCYLLVSISNTMLPSSSDRSAWLPVGVIILVFCVVLAVAGFRLHSFPWAEGIMLEITETLLKAFSVAAGLNLCLVFPLWVVDRFLLRLKGRGVASSGPELL